MIFHLDVRSGMPTYMQLINQVRRATRNGTLRAHERRKNVILARPLFPFVNDLVNVFQISLSKVIGKSRTRLPVA